MRCAPPSLRLLLVGGVLRHRDLRAARRGVTGAIAALVAKRVEAAGAVARRAAPAAIRSATYEPIVKPDDVVVGADGLVADRVGDRIRPRARRARQ